MERIVLSKPSMTALEASYVQQAVTDGWGANCYQWIARFERGLTAYLGVQHAVATSSGTGALHLGLAALGIGPGDEVILADTNWIATAAPITYVGAKPVFVDISPESWCIDPARVEAAITPRTRAIIATHLYGNLCDMDALLALGQRHQIPVIEDAAEALGSSAQGRMAGSMGRFGIFSFHGSKTITTGEGGMFVTDDSALYERVKQLNNHGRSAQEPRQFWPEMVGFKYKMTDLQAALGCAQLERIQQILARKRAVLHRYKAALERLPGVHLNPEPPDTEHGAWMPNVVFDETTGVGCQDLLQAFQQANIDARVFFWPLSSLPIFGAEQRRDSWAWRIQERSINLPSYVDMSDAEQDRVIAVIEQVARRGGRL